MLKDRDEPLASGELAEMTGVSKDTLRHYERLGILPAPKRCANRYRSYPPEAAGRVRLIRAALAVGFSLDELRRILRIRDQGGAPCRSVRDLASAKLSKLELRIVEMKKMRATLAKVLADWDERLAGMPPGVRASLLETLAESGIDLKRIPPSGNLE